MKAGKLRHRIEVQHDTSTTVDAAGHITPSNQPFGKRWASIEHLSGRELWNAQQVQPDVTHRVRIRYLDGLNERMRLRFKERGKTDRYLNILTINNVQERDIEQELLCMEAK